MTDSGQREPVVAGVDEQCYATNQNVLYFVFCCFVDVNKVIIINFKRELCVILGTVGLSQPAIASKRPLIGSHTSCCRVHLDGHDLHFENHAAWGLCSYVLPVLRMMSCLQTMRIM